ncbi:c-type cytochrome [Pendulispora albinea]|uniref:Cytochrome c n=1 Tax=Pendulispora albinea TaxID=2741071 RepID=A0ABZ2MAZ7_9BACT
MKALPSSHFYKYSAAFALLALAAAACDRAPSSEGAREWTPTDHDRIEERGRLQAGIQAAPAPRGSAAPAASGGSGGDDSVVELTWQNQCVVCHGRTGHGDGPNGPMVRAPDLTREEWQAKVTDAEIGATIRTGKNQMPRFDLSDRVVAGLVSRIRAARGR